MLKTDKVFPSAMNGVFAIWAGRSLINMNKVNWRKLIKLLTIVYSTHVLATRNASTPCHSYACSTSKQNLLYKTQQLF